MSLAAQKKIIILFVLIAAGVFFYGSISGCGYVEPQESVSVEEQMIPTANFVSTFTIPMPDAPGLLTESNDRAFIDYSNKHDGYITVKFLENTDRRLMVMITTPDGDEYIYDLSPEKNEVFPLTSGDGRYKISIHEHVTDNVFLDIMLIEIDVELSNEFVPFIRPNQYVYYSENSPVTKKAVELSNRHDNFIDTVEAVFNYVVESVSYDFDLARTVTFGYKPDLDEVLDQGSGICFDIAALTVAMLRSRGIPSKLVFGDYYGSDLDYPYHAWVTVFSEEDVRIGEHIFFKAGTWNILDPTVAIILCLSETDTAVSDGVTYNAKYYY